jgi:superfamily II DNA helicase RecQ
MDEITAQQEKILQDAFKAFGDSITLIEEDKIDKHLNEVYKKYISSPEWQAKRSERLRIDNYTCQKCGGLRGLHVHHINYKNFGNENVYDDLITLCEKCHKDVERQKQQNDKKMMEECERRIESDRKAREELKNKEKTRSINSLFFLNHEEKNDIGFGGADNLCNMQKLIKALKKYGMEREDVYFGQIQQYLAYHRWIMARKLYSEGLTVYKVAAKMNWKYERIIKAIDDDQFGQLKAIVDDWLMRCHKVISAE